MKKIQIAYAVTIMVLTGLWLLAEGIFTENLDVFASWRMLLYYSGIIGIGVMSLGMMLAVRPVVLEPYFGGLDKMYRLHKWLGVTGLCFAIMHWISTQAPHWFAASTTPPVREAKPVQTVAIFQYFDNLSGIGKVFGEWGFYAAAILIVLALVKWFPYRYFFKTHRILALLYLLLVFHSTVLMKFTYWTEPLGFLMVVLMAVGTLAALISLFRRIGANRRAIGVIEKIVPHPNVKVIDIVTLLKSKWSGHQAGQFAFVTFDKREGPHPFTITSTWRGDGAMQLIIKELGDYTRTLPTTLKAGDEFSIEGPYGQFTFQGNEPRQIWIAGGIGISAFVARMKFLSDHPDGKVIDLFHTTKVFDDGAITLLRNDAKSAKVNLHILTDAVDGLLTADRIFKTVLDWKTATIWFCGPTGFGDALRQDFTAAGLPSNRFHQELFEIR
jgi:predicted ferric reductase